MKATLPGALPKLIENEAALDELMTRPRAALIEFVKTLKGPLLVLGAGGKMGPTLAVLARRAIEAAGAKLDVLAVSRFSNPQSRRWLEERGVKTLSCDLLDPRKVKRLPDAYNIIYLAGFKFGTTDAPWNTWAINTLVPSNVAVRYPESRIVALSSGNIYGLSPVTKGGSVETDVLQPVGEYANACLARERLFEYYSRANNTPIALIRLNYAVEMRYGVLRDVAQKVWDGRPVDVTMGHLNCIWQGDANEYIIRALAETATPAAVLNLTGAPVLAVRDLAEQFSRLMKKPVQFTGQESPEALLSNPARICKKFGKCPTRLKNVLRWTAHWVQQGGATLNKPTHFESKDGKF